VKIFSADTSCVGPTQKEIDVGYYYVYYDGALIAKVNAFSESDAVDRVYMTTGSASANSGRARRLYSAVRQ